MGRDSLSDKMASNQDVAARKQQDLQAQYNNYKTALQSLAQKVGEIEQEVEEHKLVTETLQPLPEDRKCFRLINGACGEDCQRCAACAQHELRWSETGSGRAGETVQGQAR